MENQVNKDTVKIFEFVFNDGEKISIDGAAIKSFGLFGILWNAQKKMSDEEIFVYATVNKYYFMIDNAADVDKSISQKASNCNVYAINMIYASGKVDEYYIRWDDDDTYFDKWQICETLDDSFVLRRR